MPDRWLWDVFLSHSHRDKERVRRLAEGLRTAGLRVWFDEWGIKPGDDIYAMIEHGLDYTRTLLMCLSQAAIDSDWGKLERNSYLFDDPQNTERRVIPVLLTDCQIPKIIRRFSYIDWRDESPEELAKLIESCRPPKPRAKAKSPRRRTTITLPTGAISSDHPLYIKREADAYVMVAAQLPAETVVIKAPRQMGKSSLLKSYLAACQAAGKHTAMMDLALFEDEQLANYPTFLTLLAQRLWRQLGQPPQAAPPSVRRQDEFTDYLEYSLLAVIPGPVVVAFDEADRVLGRAYQNNFFSLLRYCHERRTDPPPTIWAKLGLALVISTEPYLAIKDPIRSPFNVGLPVQLRALNEAECDRLNRLYRARLTKTELGQLMELLNGHPHLTHLAFYSLTGPQKMDFPTLLRTATERGGPFGSHLRALENKLIDEVEQKLLTAMKQLVNEGKSPSREAFYRLHGAGLVREEGKRIVPMNQLYARFFGDL